MSSNLPPVMQRPAHLQKEVLASYEPQRANQTVYKPTYGPSTPFTPNTTYVPTYPVAYAQHSTYKPSYPVAPNQPSMSYQPPYHPTYGQPTGQHRTPKRDARKFQAEQQHPTPRRNPQPIEKTSRRGHKPTPYVVINENKEYEYRAPIRYPKPPTTSGRTAFPRRNSEPTRTAAKPVRLEPQYPNPTRWHDSPDHMFISFSSTHTLRFGQIPSFISREEMKFELNHIWNQGYEYEFPEPPSQDTGWEIKWNGSPWTESGEEGVKARRMVKVLFDFLARYNCTFISIVHASTPWHSPTLIFARSIVKLYPTHYFMITFSKSRRKMFFIDAPAEVLPEAESAVLHGFPEASQLEMMYGDDNVWCIRLSSIPPNQQDLPHKLAIVLKTISERGYRLEASVPMAREGFLGRRGRREVWMFKANVAS